MRGRIRSAVDCGRVASGGDARAGGGPRRLAAAPPGPGDRRRSAPSTASAAPCCGSTPSRPGSTPASTSSTRFCPPTSARGAAVRAAPPARGRPRDVARGRPAGTGRPVRLGGRPRSRRVAAARRRPRRPGTPGWPRTPADIAAEWLGPTAPRLLPRWVEYLCAASAKMAGCLDLLRPVEARGRPDVAANVARSVDRDATPARGRGPRGRRGGVGRAGQGEELGKKAWPDRGLYEADEGRLRGLPHGPAEAARPVRRGRRRTWPRRPRSGSGSSAWRRSRTTRSRPRKRRRGRRSTSTTCSSSARDLLRDHARRAGRLQERFRYVLVDELQDTDPVQMDLVERLCGGGLTARQAVRRRRPQAVDLPLPRGRRGAVPRGCGRRCRRRPAGADAELPVPAGRARFVNALFAGRCRTTSRWCRTTRPQAPGACVEFLWADPARGGSGDDAEPSAARRRGVPPAEADAIARRIAALLDAAAPRVGTKDGPPRRADAGDVVLLFRSMSNVAIYEAALRAARARLLPRRRPGVLRPAGGVRPAQPAPRRREPARRRQPRRRAAVAVLLPDRRGGSPARHPRRRAVGRAVRRRHAGRAARRPAAARRAGRAAPPPLAGAQGPAADRPAARRASSPTAATTRPCSSSSSATASWPTCGSSSTWPARSTARACSAWREFTARLGDLVVRQPREEQAATQPENADVVRLMTIHQAKGLEFPVVFVPDLAAAGRGRVPPAARWDRGLGCLVRLPAEFETFAAEEGVPFSSFAGRAREDGRPAGRLGGGPAHPVRRLHAGGRPARPVGRAARAAARPGRGPADALPGEGVEPLDARPRRALRPADRPVPRRRRDGRRRPAGRGDHCG